MPASATPLPISSAQLMRSFLGLGNLTSDLAAQVTAGGYWTRLPIGAVAGAFSSGETITGGTSAATATAEVLGGSFLDVLPVSGTFRPGELLTGGTSHATALVTGSILGPLDVVLAEHIRSAEARIHAVTGIPFFDTIYATRELARENAWVLGIDVDEWCQPCDYDLQDWRIGTGRVETTFAPINGVGAFEFTLTGQPAAAQLPLTWLNVDEQMGTVHTIPSGLGAPATFFGLLLGSPFYQAGIASGLIPNLIHLAYNAGLVWRTGGDRAAFSVGAVTGGPFVVGETVTSSSPSVAQTLAFGTSGAAATVLSVSDGVLAVQIQSGRFARGQTLTGGTSGGIAVLNGVATTLSGYNPQAYPKATDWSQGLVQEYQQNLGRLAAASVLTEIVDGARHGGVVLGFDGLSLNVNAGVLEQRAVALVAQAETWAAQTRNHQRGPTMAVV